MKILYFGGGLGNQIFEYYFYEYMAGMFARDEVYGVYPKGKFREHAGGLEVDRVFDVSLPPSSLSSASILLLIYFCKKVLGCNALCSLDPCVNNLRAIAYNAFKTDKVYYEKSKLIDFRKFDLGARNEHVLSDILTSYSVSLHVRRGDYLSAKYSARLAGIATEAYYQNAIKIIETYSRKPKFFVFSDDPAWVRAHLRLPNAVYVDWNVGKDSYKDLFLMTHCRSNIIANSTFSYWGAYLNRRVPIVVYPKVWIHPPAACPDIFPESWIGVGSC